MNISSFILFFYEHMFILNDSLIFMPGPYRRRRIQGLPKCQGFKPAGKAARNLDTQILSLDEYEAIRLADFLKLDHHEAATKMGISRPTFTRLIEKARHNVASALVEGKELVIGGGNIDVTITTYRCKTCGDMQDKNTGVNLKDCPACGSENLENMMDHFLKHQTSEQFRKRRRRGD